MSAFRASFRKLGYPLLMGGLVFATGCSDYRSFNVSSGQSWAEAQRIASREARRTALSYGPEATATADARYRVRRGDTLGGLAQRYALAPNEIVRANGLSRPYALREGQVLSIPGRSGVPSSPARPSAVPPTMAASVLPPAVPSSPSIPAERPTAPVPAAVLASPLPPPEPALPTARPPASPVVVASADPTAALPAPDSEPAADPEITRKAQHEHPPPLSGDGFVWPTKGKVVSGYGEKPNGQRNDGINIGAKAGTPVLAAENGIVVFADAALSGFGRMLLIRHAGGYTTAYAHLQSFEVAVGDRVSRGQQIGRVGVTGDVRTAQLHFEIRSGTKPVEPTALLVEPRNQLAGRG